MRHPFQTTGSLEPQSRRDFLWSAGGGLGGAALACLLGEADLLADNSKDHRSNAGLHHPARARRVIQLFMNGGVSQCDTFDYKPLLRERNGQTFDPGVRVEAVTGATTFSIMGSPFKFRRHGESGRWVSEVFPRMAEHVDDMAFFMSMSSKTNVHGPGSYMMNTGFVQPGFPCFGAWVSYGLGNLTDNLPTFVVMPDPRGLPYNNQGNFSSGFLSVSNQGTIIKAGDPNPIADLFPPESATFITAESESAGLALLNELNRENLQRSPGDSRLEARIAAYELAARMQSSAPELLELERETLATHRLYGLDRPETSDFGRRCLLGRRMLERGVRFVQIWSGAGGASNNWDNHSKLPEDLPVMAMSVDQPIAALLSDLKARGLLEDTLVVFSTEFGRQPFSQNQSGRDHNGGTFVSWIAGGGAKGGATHGQSDEWSWRAVEPIWCYDFHATLLHLLGIDHERLTFRHNGFNRRLTDVHGRVVRELLA